MLSGKINCLDNCLLHASERPLNVYRKRLSKQFILLHIAVRPNGSVYCLFTFHVWCFTSPATSVLWYWTCAFLIN